MTNPAFSATDATGSAHVRRTAWVVQMGEPLPTDVGNPRLMRSGQLATALSHAGYDVVLWSSRFRYYDKTFRPVTNEPVRVSAHLSVVHVESPGYARNISIRRLTDHQVLARNFAAAIVPAERPDVIHCAFPTIEVAYEATKFAARSRVPIIVDVRDMWPDAFLHVMPRAIRPLGHIALTSLRRQARSAMAKATALSAHTSTFLDYALRQAGRPQGPLDSWFPFAYPAQAPSAPDADTADWISQLDGPSRPTLRICFFGNLDSMRSDVDFRPLLDAIRSLDSVQRRQIQLVICGAGRLAELIRAQAAGMREVVFPGWIDAPQIRALLTASQFGYLPYLPSPDFLQSIPNKAVEYLSGGLPIITSLTRGVLHDVLSDAGAGYSYNAADSTALAATLARCIADPSERIARSANAKVLFESTFESGKVMTAMMAQVRAVQDVGRHPAQVRGAT